MSGREKPLILQNGMPIPQAYDKDLGDWTEYSTEHIKAIKAELALVKAELQTIKANQLSGDQKVQLSGAIVSKKHLNAPFGNRFYGENIALNIETVQPLVGSFKNMMIYIENNATAAIGYLHVYGLIAGDLISLALLTMPDFSIAAGAKRLLTTNDEELGYLKDVPLEGLAILPVFTASGTGTVNVYLAGGE